MNSKNYEGKGHLFQINQLLKQNKAAEVDKLRESNPEDIVKIKQLTLELSDLLIKVALHDMNVDLREFTKKYGEFYGPAFLNEAM